MEAIVPFVSGRYVFIAQPTGYGKSFCFGCLPLVFTKWKENPIVLVVSLLVALMKDQVTFTDKGLSAAIANSAK